MSDWKEGANKRRDERHTKSPDEPDKGTPKISKKKKDTKKWCKGKVGVEHQLKCYDYDELKNKNTNLVGSYAKNWKVLSCTICGKQIETFIPRNNNSKPDWVK
jgi:hypothetical protein